MKNVARASVALILLMGCGSNASDDPSGGQGDGCDYACEMSRGGDACTCLLDIDPSDGCVGTSVIESCPGSNHPDFVTDASVTYPACCVLVPADLNQNGTWDQCLCAYRSPDQSCDSWRATTHPDGTAVAHCPP